MEREPPEWTTLDGRPDDPCQLGLLGAVELGDPVQHRLRQLTPAFGGVLEAEGDAHTARSNLCQLVGFVGLVVADELAELGDGPAVRLLPTWLGAGHLPIPVVDERNVATFADDEVVQNSNTNQVADLAQAPGDLEVLFRRSRVSGRMIVDEENRRR